MPKKLILSTIISMVLTGCFSDSGSSQPPSVEPPSSNHPPSVESVPELTALVDHKVTYQLVASDRDGDSLSYQLNDAPDFVSVDKLGLVTIAPKEPDQDQYQFSISVSDGKAKVTTQIQLNVFAQPTASCPEDTTDPECNNDSGFQPNFAPELNVDAQIDVKADIASNYQVSAKDYNGDQLSFSLNQAPSWASIDSQGLMSFVPTVADVGTYELAVIVSDGTFDVTADTQVTVHLGMTPVDPDLINHAPVVDPIPALKAKVQRPSTYQVLATDKDGDALAYSLKDAPDFVSISENGLLYIEPLNNSNTGSHHSQVLVSDGSLTTSRNLTIHVSEQDEPGNDNNAPIVQSIAPLTAFTDQTLEYQVIASDRDGDRLSFSLNNSPEFVSITQSGVLTFAPTPVHEGNHQFDVTVSDGKLSTKTTVIAQVHLPTASCDEDSTAPECVNPDEGMEVTFYKASLTASNKPLKGDVSCNGQSLLEGHFNTTEGDSFTCYLESLDSSSIELGSFIAPDHKSQSLNSDALVPIAFELTNVIGKGDNAAKVLESISSCPESQQVCLKKMDSIDIAGIYNSAALNSDETVGAFLAAKSEESTDDVGKAPSSHRDPNLVPAVSGGDNDLNSDFVSSNAEASLTYQPS
ncbi:Ig-like domain-containing protein, partial [Vibrio rotiferianus]